MEEFGVFMVNEDTHKAFLEEELKDILLTVESMLAVAQPELLDAAIDLHQQRFVHIMIEQLRLTKLLYKKAYGVLWEDESEQNVFYLNPGISDERAHHELTTHIYQINSICYLSAHHILVDELDDHLINTLGVINNCTSKMVRLVDTLNLHRY